MSGHMPLLDDAARQRFAAFRDIMRCCVFAMPCERYARPCPMPARCFSRRHTYTAVIMRSFMPRLICCRAPSLFDARDTRDASSAGCCRSRRDARCRALPRKRRDAFMSFIASPRRYALIFRDSDTIRPRAAARIADARL